MQSCWKRKQVLPALQRKPQPKQTLFAKRFKILCPTTYFHTGLVNISLFFMFKILGQKYLQSHGSDRNVKDSFHVGFLKAFRFTNRIKQKSYKIPCISFDILFPLLMLFQTQSLVDRRLEHIVSSMKKYPSSLHIRHLYYSCVVQDITQRNYQQF